MLSMASPLTPALSPLRGEGVAVDARHTPGERRRVPAVSDVRRGEELNVTNAANDVRLTETFRRAPSPLNGERAGVRGENGYPRPFAHHPSAATNSLVASPPIPVTLPTN